jgi:hypothetical protein
MLILSMPASVLTLILGLNHQSAGAENRRGPYEYDQGLAQDTGVEQGARALPMRADADDAPEPADKASGNSIAMAFSTRSAAALMSVTGETETRRRYLVVAASFADELGRPVQAQVH